MARTLPAPRKAPPIPLRVLKRRDPRSIELDEPFPDIPFIAWANFIDRFKFKIGEHITLIGKNGSGKTVLAVEGLIPNFKWGVVLGTKQTDPSLYGPLRRQGYVVTRDPLLDARKTPRVIFTSKTRGLSTAIRAQQTEEFRLLLSVIYAEGKWMVYADELPYLADSLGLEGELETIWLQGRSEKITIIASTQNPVSVPRVAFDQVRHLFIFRQKELDRVDRMAEIAGSNKRLFRSIVPSLADYEALYINTADDVLVRTKYET